ncbi:MAG: DUF2849 domain-containing protein [Methylovirgula sp.]
MQVVSANRLSDGTVVYLNSQANWGESLASATVFATSSEVEAGLHQAQAAIAANEVVDAFAVPVEQGVDGLHAVSFAQCHPRTRPDDRVQDIAHSGDAELTCIATTTSTQPSWPSGLSSSRIRLHAVCLAN